MSDGINDILPLIRKHFDFLNTEYGFSCQRTWSDYMARYQGAEYRRDHPTIKVEQADSPIFEVHLKVEMQGEALSGRLENMISPKSWAERPQGHAWPRPIQQDEEQLRFLAACLRHVIPGFLERGFSRQM